MNSENIKFSDAYRTIGEIAKELNLINNKNGKLQTHTLRFWEKEFKQIKPTIRAGNRRYYSEKDFQIIKLVKRLLKDECITIKGVKKILNNQKTNVLDVHRTIGVNTPNLNKSKSIKSRIDKIKKILNELRNLKHG